jgi:hypothetical protein
MSKRHHRITGSFVLAFLIPACAAHESVGRPPSFAEISRLNEFAARNGNAAGRVDYVGPIPVCAADGVCQQSETVMVAQVESFEFVGDQLVVRTPNGAVGAVPSSAVDLISVKDHRLGALRGAGVGAGVGLGVSLALALFLTAVSGLGEGRPNSGCGFFCGWGIPVVTGLGALAGAGFGSNGGPPRTFQFDRPAPATRQ